MSQFRFHNWQDDDSTFALNQRLKGLLPDGRYRGYDLKPFVAGMNLILWHDSTGYKYIKQDLTSFTKVGCAITKQGMIINETGEISITIQPNLSGSARIDLIVMEHFYEEIVGGTDAIYYAIEGTPFPPPLSDPDKQVIIGYLLVPAGTTSLTNVGVSYTPAVVPYFANDTTKFDAIYTEIAALALSNLTDVTVTSPAAGHILVHNGTEFVNVSSKTHIEGLQLNLNELLGQSGVTHTDPAANGQNLVGGGVNEFGYIVTDNLVVWDLASSSTRKISRLTNSPIGTVIRMTWKTATPAGLVMGGAGDYGTAIADTHNRTGTIPITINKVYTFVKLVDYWLMLEEMPRANYTQTDPNALDYIQNKPAPFVQTKADWTQANPVSDAFIQNKPKIYEIIGHFDIIVTPVGPGTTLPLINISADPDPVQGQTATVIASNARFISMTVNLTNPNNYNYLVQYFVTSNNSTEHDSIGYPTTKLVTTTQFDLGINQVETSGAAVDITLKCILVKLPT